MSNYVSPQQILFVEKLGLKNRALFASQKNLAEALLLEPSFEHRKIGSMKAYINQVLKPANEKYSRPISIKLRDAIYDSIAKRVRENVDLESLIERLERAFEDLKSEKHVFSGSGEAVSDFLKRSNSASELFIVTDEPAELFNTPMASELTDILAKKTGLVSKLDGEEYFIDAKYIFMILDDKKVAENFWVNLFKHLRNSKAFDSKEDQEIKNEIIEVNNSKNIIVNVWTPPFGRLPICIFNPKGNDAVGYFVDHRESLEAEDHYLSELTPKWVRDAQHKIYDPYFIRDILDEYLEVVSAEQVLVGGQIR